MYREVLILLPCHSLEDFPTYHEGEEAESLLACWTAMWHPRFIASSHKMPQWSRVDDPPEDIEGKLILVPSISQQELPAGFTRRATESGATVIRRMKDREEILQKALTPFAEQSPIDEELAADFLALGYCYLQVELLTRQMRYSSSLDELYFNDKVVEAADALIDGKPEACKEALQACFDVLAEERNQFYSVDSYFVDITLCASTVLGPSLSKELKASTTSNFMISGEVLSELAEKKPENLELLKQKLSEESVGLIGGEYHEGTLPLQSPEAILANFKQGHQVYEKHLGKRPTVFGRRRFGLSPFLPQLLSNLGYQGAFHLSLDEGSYPESSQSKVRWEGFDGTSIDALAKPPIDASKPDGFLGLFMRLGEAMDSEHVATVCFAHWPSMTCTWYEDLRRIERYADCLGKFVTVEQYFQETDIPPFHDNFSSSNYRSPYFKQSVIKKQQDPISTHLLRNQYNARIATQNAVNTFSALISNKLPEQDKGSVRFDIEPNADKHHAESLLKEADPQVDAALQHFITAMPRTSSQEISAYIAINPNLFNSIGGVELNRLAHLPASKVAVVASGESDGDKHASINIPACGYAWINEAPGKPEKAEKPLGDGNILRNEFMEVHISETTGAIESIYDFKTRGNRLSQQLALRLPGPRPKSGSRYVSPDATAVYSKMAADEVTLAVSTPAMGKIVTRGRLVDAEGNVQAKFEQTYQLWRSSRVLEVGIELEPLTETKGDPWSSYYCCRFAWSDETASIYRDVNWVRRRSESNRIEAPNFVEIENGKSRTAILTGGLPFHRKMKRRMLESILSVRGESTKKFRLGIAIDAPYPIQAARDFAYRPAALFETASAPGPGASSWTFHCSAKNVLATHWEPLVKEGKVIGFSVRLLETESRDAKGTLRCLRNVERASVVDFCGEKMSDCTIEEDKIHIQLAPGQWQQINAYW